jgi:selenocysteine lyase/cysteine desulfurase
MLTRRDLLKTSSLLALQAVAPALPAQGVTVTTLPDRQNFRCQEFETCLNSGRWHPLSNGARAAVNRYHEYKQRGVWDHPTLEAPADPTMHGGAQAQSKALFAKLINASPDEIAFVQSTTAGENLVVQSLGLPHPGTNIVTDGLHFEGSLYLYDQLRRQGADIRIVKPRGWRIEMADLERVIDKNTRLVAVSMISSTNGFEHDVKALAKLAHERGALLYVDIVQAAGAMPVDVQALGMDFAATASYKWLQGDFGLGFLYVKKSVLAGLRRPVMSYRQIQHYATHLFPDDAVGKTEISYEQSNTTAGYFEQGTLANGISETLAYSLDYLQTLGVGNVQTHIQSLIAQLRIEVPKLGHELVTPVDARGPLITFRLKDPVAIGARLKAAKIDVTLGGDRMRVSPAVFNDSKDIDRLLAALKS